MQDLSNRNWIFQGNREDYLNPANFLGIPNVEGTTAICTGIIPINKKKEKFKWVLYARKLRKERRQQNGK